MTDLVEETQAWTLATEVNEDYGYVHRDSGLLQKALTADVKASDNNTSDTGSDVKREATDVGSASGDGAAPAPVDRSVDNRDPADVDVRVNVTSLDEENEARKKGILKGTLVSAEFEGVYDGTKKRTPSVSSTTSSTTDSLGLPKPSSKKSVTGAKKMSASKTLSAGPVKEDLPQMFQVKYLGHQDARGLWGIKHTRRPVDNMVTAAKTLRVGTVLPMVKLVVTKDGVIILPATAKSVDDEPRTCYSIDTISYGVQDLVYTRVFSMIVVKDSGANAKEVHPFECHAFVCESRHSARRLTYSLAAAFQEYSKAVNGSGTGDNREKVARIKKRFAIDLRSPDEIEADLEEETEA